MKKFILIISISLLFCPKAEAVFNGDLNGNATTATALQANGGNCNSGNFPLGVDASGAVESCEDALTQAELIDEDNMASDSAVRPPSQQSVKAYVDAGLTAQDECSEITNCTPNALSTVDISSNTNLSAGTNITLNGDTLNVDDVFVSKSDWTTHDNYPSACPGGQFVTGLGDTLTCNTPAGSGDMSKSTYDPNDDGSIDISSNTNLSAATNLSLVGDTLSVDDAFVLNTGDTMTGALNVPDDAYNATSWNGSTEVPTKNALRDKIETLGSGSGDMLQSTYDPNSDGVIDISSNTNLSASTNISLVGDTLSVDSSPTFQSVTVDGTDPTIFNYNKNATNDVQIHGDSIDNILLANVSTNSIIGLGTWDLSGATVTLDVDYEEETHASEHLENAADELTVEGLGTACTNGQTFKSDGSGGVDCASDLTGSGGGGSVGDSLTDEFLVNGGNTVSGSSGIKYQSETSILIDLSSTNRALRVTRLLSPSGNISTPRNGMIAYDSTDDQLQGYIGGTWVDIGGAGSGTTYAVRVTKSGNQTTATATTEVLTWDQEDYDTSTMHDNSTNNSRLTAPANGYYTINAGIRVQPGGTSNAANTLIIKVNGSTIARQDFRVNNTAVNYHTITTQYYLASGQYAEVFWAHNLSSDLFVDADASTYFSMHSN